MRGLLKDSIKSIIKCNSNKILSFTSGKLMCLTVCECVHNVDECVYEREIDRDRERDLPESITFQRSFVLNSPLESNHPIGFPVCLFPCYQSISLVPSFLYCYYPILLFPIIWCPSWKVFILLDMFIPWILWHYTLLVFSHNSSSFFLSPLLAHHLYLADECGHSFSLSPRPFISSSFTLSF